MCAAQLPAASPAVVAHLMFDAAADRASAIKLRTGPANGLASSSPPSACAAILAGIRFRAEGGAGGWSVSDITAAYWFTASTCFANPAVTSRAR